MLSKEQSRIESMYAYRAGMLNNAWIAGIARSVTRHEAFIQQTNNKNTMIHFTVDAPDLIPSWVKDGSPIKINARLHGERIDNEPVVRLQALAFDRPSIIDMPAREWWDFQAKEGVPLDDIVPEGLPDLASKMGGKSEGFQINDTGNMVRVAGFVSGFVLEPPGVLRPDGTVSSGCVVLSLRQVKDINDVIPIRVYGSKAAVLTRRLVIGMPVSIAGKIRVRIKETGAPAGPDGILPVRKCLYVHTNMISIADKSQIHSEPDWAKEMVKEQRSKRQAARDAQDKRELEAAALKKASMSVEPTPVPAMKVKPAAPADALQLGAVDPDLLAKLGK